METVNQEESLKRIADTLENINQELSSINSNMCGLEDSLNVLSELSKCIAYIPPRYHQKEGYYIFRIGGQVETE